MPGFEFAYRENGQPPVRVAYPLAKSMNGTGTPPAAAMKAGDLVAYTTVAALTTSSAKVMRPLLAADKTANYEEGGVRCGIFGVSDIEQSTDSSGIASSPSTNGGYQGKVSGIAGLNPKALNGHSQHAFIAATKDTVFKAKLKTAAASAVAFLALVGSVAGVDIAVSSGVSTYTVDTGESGEDLNLQIVGVDEEDSTFLTVFVKFLDYGASPAGSYMQHQTSVAYSTQ